MATCFELRAALEDLGLSQRRLSRLCGVDAQQAWRWCNGWTQVPAYVWTLLSMIKSGDCDAVLGGHRERWHVERHHVYRGKERFKELARRWHPDVSGRDTNEEMKYVIKFRAS